MSASAKGRASAALLVMAALAVGGGLALTGGPATGRAERRDETRYDDMRRLVGLVDCLAGAGGDRLPQSIAASDYCPSPARLTDPFSGQPYRYEIIDAASYRLCVEFELPFPARRLELEEYDAASGCFVQRIEARPRLPDSLTEAPVTDQGQPQPVP